MVYVVSRGWQEAPLKIENPLRNTLSDLRFPLLVYVYVHSHRGSRVLRVLLASCSIFALRLGATVSVWQYSVALCVSLGHVRLCTLPAEMLARLVLLAPCSVFCALVELYNTVRFFDFAQNDSRRWGCACAVGACFAAVGSSV